MEERKDEVSAYIGCPRFGGRRLSYACAHFDRYRGCRKACASLKKEMESSPVEFVLKVKEAYGGKESFASSKHSCLGLPIEEKKPFACEVCGYAAKSERGLKSHRTRSHS